MVYTLGENGNCYGLIPYEEESTNTPFISSMFQVWFKSSNKVETDNETGPSHTEVCFCWQLSSFFFLNNAI